MKYSQLVLYYFSGTGNSKNAALWFEALAKEKGLDTHVINIDRYERYDIPTLTGHTLIGFFSPTHGFNLPPIALKFIARFPKLQNAEVFLLNTRAGMKLGKLFLPGLSGLAQVLPACMLRLKGYRIVGMQPLDLPSNWLILHPALKAKVVDSVYARCRGIVNRFAEQLLSGKRKYKALWSLPVDLALLPVAFGYYFFGRFFLAKTLVATLACNACGICAEQCPVRAIEMIRERPFWGYTCESCMRCINACPKRAIETAHGFAILLLLFSSMVFSPLLIAGLKISGLWELVSKTVLNQKIWLVVYTLIFLLVVSLSYRILHFLMRYKFVSKLVVWTSLSRFTWWRRYRAPKYKTAAYKYPER